MTPEQPATGRKCPVCTPSICCICQGVNDSCDDQPNHPGPSADAKRIKELGAEVERLTAELTQTRNNRLISAIFGHHKGAPKPFALYRSGEVRASGLIALGAEFPDGAVALRLANEGGWTTKSEGGAEGITPSYATIVWLSDELESLAAMEQDRDQLSEALADADREIERLTAALRRNTVHDNWAPNVLAGHNPPVGRFEGLLADPNEQFDPRAELLASITEYTNAPPASASAHPKRNPQAVTQ